MRKRPSKPPVPGALAFTIEQFCRQVSMSRSTYEKMQKEGKGPKEMQMGAAVRISLESARAWIKERERERRA